MNNAVIWIGTGIIFISFITALLIPQSTKSYMKGFFLCPLMALLVSLNSICGSLFLMYSINLFFLIQSFLFLLDLLFWSKFFLTILNHKSDAVLIKILTATVFLIAFYLLFVSKVNKQNLHTVALSTICKTIFCVIYYSRLFKYLFYQNILSEPSFWIVTGVILYSCLSLPFYGLNSYIKLQFPQNISSSIFSISNILIIIMHLFFAKAYICTIRLHKA